MDLGVETGASAGPRRRTRRPGFMGEMAEGIAGAVLSAPELAAVVLLAATVWLRNVALCVGVAHVAGMALARMRSDHRILVVVGWIGLTAIPVDHPVFVDFARAA